VFIYQSNRQNYLRNEIILNIFFGLPVLDVATRLRMGYLYLCRLYRSRLICVVNFGCFGWYSPGTPVYLNLL